MKKIIAILMTLVMIFALTAVSVSAVDYSKDGISFTVPDVLKEDRGWALENGYTNSWCDEDVNIELILSIDVNDDEYTYVNYSDSDLESIYDHYIKGSGYDFTKNTVENVTINDFEGILMDMDMKFEDEETRHICYLFSTQDTIYSLYFYVYDDDYVKYVDEIAGTIMIEGSENDPETEGNIIYIVILAISIIGSAIISVIKKKKAKKQGIPTDYVPLNNNGENVVFDPQKDMANQNFSPASDDNFAAEELAKEKEEIKNNLD